MEDFKMLKKLEIPSLIFEKIITNTYPEYSTSANFITDVETGVMYIGISGYGITPRLERDGKPMINPNYNKK